MLQQSEPDDYVIATGRRHSIREFLDVAFGQWDWTGGSTVEIGLAVHRLGGGPAHRRLQQRRGQKFGWAPKTKFAELATLMVERTSNS